MAILLPSRSPTIWFLKLSLFLLTTLSLTSLAYLKLPQATKAQALYTSLKPWLTTPYLFIAVHLIIAIIWKLSDYHTHSDHDGNSAKLTSFHTSPAEHEFPMTEQMTVPNYAPSSVFKSNYSVENSAKSTSFDNSPAELLHHEFPVPKPKTELNYALPSVLESKNSVETDVEVESSVAGELEDEEENVSMEETWRAIVEKKTNMNTNTNTNTKAASRRWRGVAGDSNEEMNRRFDDFIKGKRDQLRLERHESNQRRLLDGN